jgi:esterase
MILNSLVTGEGPSVVLLHGLFGAARNLGVIARALSGTARVVSLDLRNHGDSPHGAAMDFSTMAADVAETMHSLRLTRASIVGHSLGGKTAMVLALTQPRLVERLVVMDIAPVSYHHDYADYVAAMRAIELRPGLVRHEADTALAQVVEEPPMRAFLLNNLVLGDAPRWRIGLKEIAQAMPDLVRWDDPLDTHPFTGPTLFLRGGDSHYVQPEADAVIARLFPNAERETVAGASHWLHADKPQQVIASLKGFLGL